MKGRNYVCIYKDVEELTIGTIIEGFIESLHYMFVEDQQLEVEYGVLGNSKMYYASPSNIRWSLNLNDFMTFRELRLSLDNEEEENDS